MIILDGKTDEELGLRVLESYEHPEPSTRDKTIAIPGRHGEYDFGADLGTISFNFPILIEPQIDRSTRNQKIEDLKKILLDPYGRPRAFQLIFDEYPEKFYIVRYRGSYSINKLLTFAQFTLPLTAFDPVSYALSSAYDPLESLDYGGGVEYDKDMYYANTESFQWVYTSHYSGVHNYSHFLTPMNFIITGACKNPKITHLETGKTLTIFDTLLSSDEIVIDSKAFTIKKNKTVNLLSKYSGDFFQLVEGDNTFMFESDSTPYATVTLDWNHRFM